MDNPVKKKSLIPRMFRAFTVYFFITIAVFFGYVELFGGVKTITGTLPDSAQGEVDMSFSNFVSNMMSLHNIYAEDVELKFEGSGMTISLNADIAVDLATSNASVSANLNVDGHVYNVGVVYKEPEVFLSIDDKVYKFATAEFGGDLDLASLSKVFMEIADILNIDFSGLAKIEDMLGIDFSNLSMETLIDKLDISTKKTNGEVKISIIAMNVIEAIITCDENCFMKSATVNGINIGANKLLVRVPTVEMNSENISERIVAPSDEGIVDMTPINDYALYAKNLFANDLVEVDFEVAVGQNSYNAVLNIDNKDGAKAKISTEVEGHKVTAIYADETVYLNVDDFGVSITVNDLKVWANRIVEIIENRTSKSVSELVEELLSKYIDFENQDYARMIQEYIKNLLSCSENFKIMLPSESKLSEDMFVLTWDNGLVVALSKDGENLSALNLSFEDVSVNVDFKVSSENVEAPTGCEDLSAVLAKLDNLLGYVETGIFEFDFVANYNGFEIAGKFKYADGVFEISDVLVAGEIANIRIEDGFVYFSYGNMKLKFVVPENGTIESVNFKEMVSKVLSDSLGVEIQFGVFEELLNMIASYTTEDWIANLVVGLTGNQDDINLSVSNKSSLSGILTANVTFVDDKIDSATVSLYDILTAQIKVDYVEQSTIKPFSADEYKEYSEDFVAGALDSLEVVPDVYGFSSDISIRYSKTTFYGEVVAMVAKNEMGEFVPAVSLHTTSLGLNIYIYVVGQMVYIDIDGLQISADLKQATIDEVLAFVENKFGVALAGEGAALMKTADAFRVVLPAIDKIYASWINEIGNGIQIKIEDGLWYGAQSRFEDIVLQAFVSNYNNIIIPTKLVIGANIYDPNTLVYDDYSDAWLCDGIDENGSKIILEDSVTQDLNFAVYFTNMSVGVFAESIDRVFAVEGKNYQNITKVESNFGVTNLSDFNSYKTVLAMVDTVYDYAMSMEYQVGISASISDETSVTRIDGDVAFAINDLAEDEKNGMSIDLFNGKKLDVRAGLDVGVYGTNRETPNSRHLIDLLYESSGYGLYGTYQHSDYADGTDLTNNIESGNAFRAKIANVNLSDIISMGLAFGKVDLGEKITGENGLNLSPNKTDFSFLHQILGMNEEIDGEEVISKADGILSSVENVTKMIKQIRLSTDEELVTTLQVIVDLNANDVELAGKNFTTISVVFAGTEVDGKVTYELKEIVVEGLSFGGKVIDVTLTIGKFDKETSLKYDKDAEHFVLNSIPEFVDAAVNTINQREFNYKGAVAVEIIGTIKLNIGVDLSASIDENGSLGLYAQLDITTSGFGSGLTSSILFGKDFDRRVAILKFSDDTLYLERYTKSGSKLSKDSLTRDSYASSEIFANLKTIIQDIVGLSDTGMKAINSIINSIDSHPSIERLLLAFDVIENGYNMTVSGSNLMGISNVDDLNITLKTATVVGVEYDDEGNLQERIYKFIDSISIQEFGIMGMVKVAVDLSSENYDSYYTASDSGNGVSYGGKLIYSNNFFRKRFIYAEKSEYFAQNLYHNGNLVATEYRLAGQSINLGNFAYGKVSGDRTVFFDDEDFLSQRNDWNVVVSGDANFYMKNKYYITFDVLDDDVSLKSSPWKSNAKLYYKGQETSQMTYEFLEGDIDLSDFVARCKYKAVLYYYYIFQGWHEADENNHYFLEGDVTIMASFSKLQNGKDGYNKN